MPIPMEVPQRERRARLRFAIIGPLLAAPPPDPDPVAVLRNRVRADRGAFPSLLPGAREALQAQYRDHPGWTAQLHWDNLRARHWLAPRPRCHPIRPCGAT